MPYQSGTASSHKDLLNTLATFAAANGWVVVDRTGAGASTTMIYLKGTGLAGLDEIYCGASVYEDGVNGRYNWQLTGSWGWVNGRAIGYHPKSSSPKMGGYLQWVYLWNTDIDYWLVATPRRIILVAQIGTSFQHMHFGLLDTPATEAQYPYPNFIGGMGVLQNQRYSDTCYAYWDENQQGQAALSWPGGNWALKTASNWGDVTPGFKVMTANESMRDSILAGLDGSYLLETFYVVARDSRGIMGKFDGLYRVSGYNHTAKDEITVGGTIYKVFPNGLIAGYGDYCALRLT